MMTGASLGIAEIFFIILFHVAFSALGAVILWGCARGIGKIKNATYLNSWGLVCILMAAQFVLSIFLTALTYLSLANDPVDWISGWLYALQWGSGAYIALWLAFYVISIFIALIITKAFWKCTFKQSVLAHMIPIIVYSLFMISYFIWFDSMLSTYPY